MRSLKDRIQIQVYQKGNTKNGSVLMVYLSVLGNANIILCPFLLLTLCN